MIPRSLACLLALSSARGDIVIPSTGGTDVAAATDFGGASDAAEDAATAIPCTFGIDTACDDGDSCTVDHCDASGACVHAPTMEFCKIDGEFVHAGAASPLTVCKVCLPARSPTAWSDLECDDENPCTEDLCDTAKGCVTKDDDTETCDDGLTCTSDDHCSGGACVASPCPCTVASDCGAALACRRFDCTDQTCISAADPAADGSACDDSDPCTTAGACANGVCANVHRDVAACGCASTADCDDGLDCTTDSCVENLNQCLSTAMPGTCLIGGECALAGDPKPDDACLACDPSGVPGDSATGDSGAWGSRVCDDSDACTTDSCAPGIGCAFEPSEGCCSTAADCDALLGPCQTASCDTGVCQLASAGDAALCSDGDPCTIADTCTSGSCVGAPLDCAPLADACHDAACALGSCETTVKAGAPCDDLDPCTTGDVCSAGGACAGSGSCTCASDGDCAHFTDACHTATCGPSGLCEAAPVPGGACDDSDPCTTDDVCQSTGDCAGTLHACTALPCQLAQCDGNGGCLLTTSPGSCLIDGVCRATGDVKPASGCEACDPGQSTTAWSARPTGATCDADGDGCTEGDACSGTTCLAATPVSCDDAKACTSDSCQSTGPTTHTCASTVNGSACFIDGACIASGSARPDNPCEWCDPAKSATAWSPAPPGTSCDADGSGCTQGDACSETVCEAGSPATCNDGLACTTDACTSTGPTSFACTATAIGDACYVDGACVTAGAPAPSGPCNVCNPAVSRTSYSHSPGGEPCDADQSGCTIGDSCLLGVCQPGLFAECDDQLACTLDTCESSSSASHTCQHALQSGCLIGGACAAAGAANPQNPCQVCAPTNATATWSARPDDAGCSADGSGCTKDDRCQSGTCVAGTTVTCDDQDACTADVCTSTGPTSYSCKNEGTTQSCTIDGKCVASGSTNPQNACQTCDPAKSTTAWSVRPEAAPCDADGSGCTVGDSCNAGTCKAGAAPICGDALACTTDSCQSTGVSSYVCKNALNGGCLIDGVCFASGAPQPGNPCRFCAPQSPSVWTSVTFGVSCGDGPTACSGEDTCDGGGSCQTNHKPFGAACGDVDGACVKADACDGQGGCTDNGFRPDTTSCNADSSGCTQNDACQGGQCLAGSAASCSDGLACTTDTCVSSGTNGYTCSATANGSGCFIGGGCYAAGALNPSNPCQECQSQSPTVWSNRTAGAPCNSDSNGCTQGDSCSGGQCVPGSAPGCNDGLACTTDGCSSTGSNSYTCTVAANSNGCYIGGACVGLGTAESGNPCRVCDAAAPTTWSSASDGTACNADSNGCTAGDYCQAGTCRAGSAYNCDDGQFCTTDSCTSLNNLPVCQSSGNGSGCLINGTCYAFSASNPTNACLTCSPSNTSGWSNAATGASCSDGDGCTSSDQCSGGTCAGSTGVCNDGQFCTTDSCTSLSATAHSCSNVHTSGCLISGTCYYEGQNAGTNYCKECKTSKSTTAFSNVANLTECPGANGGCGRCSNGSCTNVGICQ